MAAQGHSHGGQELNGHSHAASPKGPELQTLITAQDESGCHELNEHLLFAVPKKGRLFDKVNELLEGCGLQYTRPNRVDIAHCKTLPVTIVFLPAADIATFVGAGNVDLGITGEDIVAENQVEDLVDVVMELGFGKCRLAVQAPISANITDPTTLLGKRIVTSFPNVTEKYFRGLQEQGATESACSVKYISGSVEAACGLGLADAIVDLVETGTTMKAAGLEIVSNIMQTQSVLIANKKTPHAELIETIRKRIAGYVTATQYVMVTFNVSRENQEEVCKIAPGKKAPTVTPLDGDGWVSISTLVKKSESHNVLDRLQQAGAEDILVFPITSTRFSNA